MLYERVLIQIMPDGTKKRATFSPDQVHDAMKAENEATALIGTPDGPVTIYWSAAPVAPKTGRSQAEWHREIAN